jgi:RNA polymerase sigma factor (sigma-70 family)
MSPSVSVRLLLTQSDTRLVQLARAGHERAFEALVERYRRPLLGYCRRMLLPHERAEDALQQGFLQAWLALREGTDVREVKPWLYRIVHNAALNMLRSGYDYAQLSQTLSGTSAPPEDLDRRIAVREALAGLAALPEMQREALLRTAVDGCSYQEAAATLGLSEGALRGLVHRARVALRTATTALTPSPLLSWALGSGGADGPLAGRLTQVGAGGSAGLAGGLLKATATAVTAGVVVGGISAARHLHGASASQHPREPVSSAATGTPARAAYHEPAFGGDRASASSGAVRSPPGLLPSHRSPNFRADRMGPRDRRVPRLDHMPPRHSTHAPIPLASIPPAGPPHLAAPTPRAEALATHPGGGSGDRQGSGGSGNWQGSGSGDQQSGASGSRQSGAGGDGYGQGDGENHQGSGANDGAGTGDEHGPSAESPGRGRQSDGGSGSSSSSSSSESSSGQSSSDGSPPGKTPQGSTNPDNQNQGSSDGQGRRPRLEPSAGNTSTSGSTVEGAATGAHPSGEAGTKGEGSGVERETNMEGHASSN